MHRFDFVLIHPPAIYDFRRKPLFPGVLARSVENMQFAKAPIGMLSIAEYLDRHGYKAIVDNLADRMTTMAGFDVEQHLLALDAPIFGVGLHFQQHAQGAVAIARLIKKLHPHSLVVMGGLTATRFHEEIIANYDFIDAVVRAEAEKPMLALVRSVEEYGKITDTPNLTYRDMEGQIRVTPLSAASQSIDEYEYTRFDLIEPQTAIHIPGAASRWSLEVCRGCTYNCAICGGSAYTYKKYLGMSRPAFRSPAKIVNDIKRLNEQGVRFIGLYQDPRMAGKQYTRELLAALAKAQPDLERLSLDMLVPADEEFIEAISKIGRRVILHLCPDTGSDAVRNRLGRHYTSGELLKTIRLCHKYRIPVTNFFSVGLAGESAKEVAETWELWARLDELNREAQARGDFGDIGDAVPIGGQILGPIVLDPGAPAFDNPERYGYKLLYPNLTQYIEGLSQPVWHRWLNYETDLLSRDAIVEMILQSTEFTIDQREKYGFYRPAEAHYERCRVEADRVVVAESEKILSLPDARQREIGMIAMRRNLDALERRRMTFFE